MRKLFFLFFCLFIVSKIYSQETGFVINSSSGTALDSSTKSMPYVVGSVFLSYSGNISMLYVPLATFINDSTSIDESTNTTLHFFPNPVRNIAIFSIERAGKYNLSVYDIDGKMVCEITDNFISDGVGAQLQIDFAKYNITAGTYFLKVSNENFTTHIKFIYW